MEGAKSVAFYEKTSWYHRIRIMNDDGTVTYTKRGGFKTAKEAEKSYYKYEKEFQRRSRATRSSVADYSLEDYLTCWLDEIFSPRVENSTRMIASYVVYHLLIPQMGQGIKLRYASTEYLDSVLALAAKSSESAGNKSREILQLAFKDAVAHGYISNNPVNGTRQYRRKKPKIVVLNKEQLRIFLQAASKSNWYLEIMLGLFLGLRKGEILGLKYGDFDVDNRMVRIKRQVTSNPIMGKGGTVISKYEMVEKDTKTPNSHRLLRVPDAVMEQVLKRKQLVDARKDVMGNSYMDHDYLCCCENDKPYSASAFNGALSKLCARSGLPHITVHGLRHMYATILVEQGVPLVKVSALLGHSSVSTTFEYYCEVMDENERIINFMNDTFAVEEEND